VGYSYQATVTVPAPTGGPHSDFTILISGSDAKLKTVGNSGAIQNTVTRTYGSLNQTVPADLIISSDAAGTSLYNWGYDFYDGVNGTALIWVKIPNYSAGLTLYISIGNAAVNTYQGGSIGAEFDANTSLALHFPDGSTLVASDFTSNGNNGSINSVTATSGKIDGAASLSGATTNKITGFSQLIPGANTDFTCEFWIKPSSVGGAGSGNAFFYQGPGTSQEGAAFMVYTGGGHSNTLRWSVANGGSYIYGNDNIISTGVWQHVVFTYEGATNTGTFYVNGVSAGSGVATGTPPTAGVSLGYWYLSTDVTRYYQGLLDEGRFSNVLRSSNWIATEYANQNSAPSMGAFSPLSNGVNLLACLGVG